MPDPNAKRDKALERIASALERQNKQTEAMNRILIDLGRVVVPTMEKMNTLLALFENETGTVSSGQMSLDENSFAIETHEDCTSESCKVAHRDPLFDYEDCPRRKTPTTHIDLGINLEEFNALTRGGWDTGVMNHQYVLFLPVKMEFFMPDDKDAYISIKIHSGHRVLLFEGGWTVSAGSHPYVVIPIKREERNAATR